MLPSLLFAVVGTQVPEPKIPGSGPIDHAPLLGGWGGLAMLAPARERWAVAVLEEVGPERKRAGAEGGDRDGDSDGAWFVFDIRARVLDGWNVPPGPLRAFWEQDGARRRRGTMARLVGSRVLMRLAPTEDGHYLWIGGHDGEPSVAPNYTLEAGKEYLSLVLPTDAQNLAAGSPNAKRWYSLWQAGASLSASAYPEFAQQVSVVTMPETGPYPEGRPSEGQVGEADVRWLQRLARRESPEFQMMVADYLQHRSITGSTGWMRDLVLLALRDPRSFPDGLFRVADPAALGPEYKADVLVWPPVKELVVGASTSKNPLLTLDLLDLLSRSRDVLPPERGRLLPLLSSLDSQVRRLAATLFELWHGKPPKDADALVWHRSRAGLSKPDLAAAKSRTGG